MKIGRFFRIIVFWGLLFGALPMIALQPAVPSAAAGPAAEGALVVPAGVVGEGPLILRLSRADDTIVVEGGAGPTTVPAGPLRLHFERPAGTLLLEPGDEPLVVYADPARNLLRLVSAGGLTLLEGDLSGSLSLAAADLHLSGPIQVAERLTVAATQVHITAPLRSGADLWVQAESGLHLQDQPARPTAVQAEGSLHLQAGGQLDIALLDHPASLIRAGGDLILRSPNPVAGDAHYLSGGQVRFEQAPGRPGSLTSPDDPIIIAAGDVSLGDYSGASLHILAGGQVTLGDVTITGPDTTDSAISLLNTNPAVGETTFADLARIELSNGQQVSVAGNVLPTLDVRAGIFWEKFFAATPEDQVIPKGVLSPTFTAPSTSADITIGQITVAPVDQFRPGGLVLLTNRYNENELPGQIRAGDINAGTNDDSVNGGRIIIDSRGDIDAGILNSEASVFEGTAGDGGRITLLADRGAIRTGDLLSWSITQPNGSGDAGDGGAILVQAGAGITIDQGAGRINSISSSNADGDAGFAGDISLTTTSGDIALEDVRAYSFATFGQTSRHGGDVLLDAQAGRVVFDDHPFFDSLVSWSSTDDAGAVTITGTQGISIPKRISARTNGVSSRAGMVTLAAPAGSINVSAVESVAANAGAAGRGGDIQLTALDRIIVAEDLLSWSNGFVIHAIAQDGGDITLQATNLISVNGKLESYSQSRGADSIVGDGGAITISVPDGTFLAGGDLNSYSASFPNNFGSGEGGDGGPISITTGGDLNLAVRLDARAESQGVGGVAGNAGPIDIATGGTLTVGAELAAYSLGNQGAGNGGPVTLQAGDDVTLSATPAAIDSGTYSQAGPVGNGGPVTLNSTGGSATFTPIQAGAATETGAQAGDGGPVTISAAGPIIHPGDGLTETVAIASAVRAPLSTLAGRGGRVTVSATLGISLADQIVVSGTGGGARGGQVTVTTRQGMIDVDDVLATSAAGSGPPGAGGEITVNSGTTIVAADLLAASAAEGVANTGSGGTISLSATEAIRIEGALDSGTQGANSLAGPGGTIVLSATQAISIGGVVNAAAVGDGLGAGPGGAILMTVDPLEGRIDLAGPIQAHSLALNGGPGGAGGTVSLSGAAIDSGDVLAYSRRLDAPDSAPAGDGGAIEMIAVNGSLALGGLAVDSRGGLGPAGSGGRVVLTATEDIDVAYIDAASAGAGQVGPGGAVDLEAGGLIRVGETIPVPPVRLRATEIVSEPVSVSAAGAVGSGRISLAHGGNGLIPFVVGDPTLNGTAAALLTGDTAITPTVAFLYSFQGGDSLQLVSVPGITLSKTVEPLFEVLPGGTVTYTLALTNLSSQPAGQVLLTDTLPAQVDFGSWLVQNGAVITDDQITWRGTVPPAGSLIFRFTARHKGEGDEQVTNVAEYRDPFGAAARSADFQVAPEPESSIFWLYLPLVSCDERFTLDSPRFCIEP